MKLNILKDGIRKTERRNLNFVDGTNVTVTITDGLDSDDSATIEIAATGGGNAVESVTFTGNVA